MQRFFLIVLLAIGSALPFAGKAAATDWLGYTGPYVQPDLIVRRPFVVLNPYYLSEYIPCGNGSVVNQGQYHTNAALIVQPRCFDGYAPVRRSKIYYK